MKHLPLERQHTKMHHFILSALLLLSYQISYAKANEREFSFEYHTAIDTSHSMGGDLQIYIPLAATTQIQKVLHETIEANIPGTVKTEPVYGNRYWHATLPGKQGIAKPKTVSIKVTTRVLRKTELKTKATAPYSTLPDLNLFLKANQRVLVSDPILKPILDEISATVDTNNPSLLSHAIYDWVVDNVEYKKIGDGWGNGDTFWACNTRYGNCTDFHALFISLARTYNIPARFEIGFPVPQDRASGNINGYHCWVQFHLPQQGWIPIDASEAFKHPEKRDFFYGSHPQDRIQFTIGRDIILDGAKQTLNYFIYPHVEVNGNLYTGKIENTFSYNENDKPDNNMASIMKPTQAHKRTMVE